jgi:hypothetical protein
MGRISLQDSEGLITILRLDEIVTVTQENFEGIQDPLIIIDNQNAFRKAFHIVPPK